MQKRVPESSHQISEVLLRPCTFRGGASENRRDRWPVRLLLESNYFGGGKAARRNGGVGGVGGVEASRIFSSINSTIESVRSGVFIRNFICVSRSGKCSDLIVQIVEFSDFIAYWYSKTEGNSLDSLSASIMHSESYTHVEG